MSHLWGWTGGLDWRAVEGLQSTKDARLPPLPNPRVLVAGVGPLHAAPSPSSAPSSELLRPAVCRRHPRDPSRRPPATAGIAVFQVPSDFRVPLGCLRWTGWLVSQLAGFGADLPAHGE